MIFFLYFHFSDIFVDYNSMLSIFLTNLFPRFLCPSGHYFLSLPKSHLQLGSHPQVFYTMFQTNLYKMQGKRWGKKGGGKRPGGGGGSGGNRQGHSGKRPGGGGTSGKRPVGGGNRQADRRKQPPSKKARRR